MTTYQDLLECMDSDNKRMELVEKAVRQHRGSAEYKEAVAAEQYYARRNVTMEKYEKFIVNSVEQAIKDVWSSNYKLTHGFFRRFVIQLTQYVLSNGISFKNAAVKEKLGANFDTQLQKLATKALVQHVAYGFWNYDHLEVFTFADTKNSPGFVPLLDEDTDQLMAGIRYWITQKDTYRYTLYEPDGITDYIKRKGESITILKDKRPYITKIKATNVNIEDISGENYSALPIFPMYGNDVRQSELTGLRASIDCYDFIKSGMANNIDETSVFYWTLKGTGGMDDVDLLEFVNRMKQLKSAVLDRGMEAEAHTLEVPVEANKVLLEALRRDLYEDAMLVDTENAVKGDITATGIRLTYQQQDDRAGAFEYEIRTFLSSLFGLIGITDDYSFNWNRIANMTEETNMVLAAADLLGTEMALRKLPWLTPEEVEEALEMNANEEAYRMARRSMINGGLEQQMDGGTPTGA